MHPTNNDDANAVTPLDLTNYAQAHILIRQPDGNVTAYPATVTGAPEINKLTGVRVDSEPPIDDTNINDGDDGTIIPGSIENVSPDPLNNTSPDSYIEIPPGGVLTLIEPDTTHGLSPQPVWGFFRGNPNARIILRLRNLSDTGNTFVSNEVSPNPNDVGVVSMGQTGTNPIQYKNAIVENAGTDTALWAGWNAIGNIGTPTTPFAFNYTSAVIDVPDFARPFTSISVGKSKTIILKRTTVQPNVDNLLLYIRGASLPSLRVYFYKDNNLQGTSDMSGINEPLSIPIDYEFDELHIEVLDDTNGIGIELGGISIQADNGIITQITDWIAALIVSPAIFPFDEDLNTETNVTDGVWFFESIGKKTLVSVAMTRPVDTIENPAVSFEVLIDDKWVIVKSELPQLTDATPTLIPINDIPRIYDHVRLVSTASFQLHELNIEGKKNTDLTEPTIEYVDSVGILTQKGPLEFWADVEYKDGTDRKSTQRAMRWVV